MIEAFAIKDKKIHWNSNPELLARLDSHYREAEDLLAKIQKSETGFAFPTNNLHLLSKHPLAHALVGFSRGTVSSKRAERIVEEITRLDTQSLKYIRNGEQFLLQLQCLIPELDTRGEAIRIIEKPYFKQSKLEQYRRVLAECCGEDYLEFTGIVKTISIVQVASKGELPYFSGADSDSWGSIHTTDPSDEFIFAETLTHEAAHHWLFLAEEIADLATDTWSGSLWVSPWRADPRPIGGVIHGVYVFSCAALVLTLLTEKLKEKTDVSVINRVRKRICRLYAQVEIGIHEMDRCPNIAEAGRSIASAAKNQLESILTYLEITDLNAARERSNHEHQFKLEKLNKNDSSN